VDSATLLSQLPEPCGGKPEDWGKGHVSGRPLPEQGVVAAFENILGQALSTPHREVLGAYGAASACRRRGALGKEGKHLQRNRKCHKRPDEPLGDDLPRRFRCHNQCKLKTYNFDGRKSIWGGECGRYELSRQTGDRKENLFEVRQSVWQSHVQGVIESVQDAPLMEVDGRPTVGMIRALYGLQNSVLWLISLIASVSGSCSHRLRASRSPGPALRRRWRRPATR